MNQAERTSMTSNKFFKAALICMWLAALGGCSSVVQSTMSAANQMDQSRDCQKLSGLLGDHIREVKQMQAQGNPMGDYLWAYANENGLIPDAEKDPERITAMYQAAADKGSADARVKLALRKFDQGALPQISKSTLEMMRRVAIAENKSTLPAIEAALKRFEDNPQLERSPLVEDLAEVGRREATWRDALVELEQATQKQCYYLKPYIFAPTRQNCLSPRIVADDVWPKFRDVGSYPKDRALRDRWFDMALACEASPAYQRAAKACTPGTAGRFKGRD
jgi:hypothetical protein